MTQARLEFIHRANVYLNGNDLLGTVEEVTPPEIKFVEKEIEAVGVFGKRTVKTGIEKLELKLKRFSLSKTNIDETAPVIGKIVGYLQTKDGTQVARTTVTIHFRGETFATVFGSIKKGEWSGNEVTLNLDHVRILIGNYEKYHIDIPADIYLMDGKDMREW